jgi:outer membrane protein assembly factor BamC
MTEHRNVRHVVLKGVLLVTSVAFLGACTSLRETISGQNAIDYQSAVRTDPLSIPPDLTQAAADPRYRAPATGSTTLTAFQSQGSQIDAAGSSGLNRDAVLPSYPDIEVKRDGDLRWLAIKTSPSELFPKIESFWYDSGFSLDLIDAKAGLMVTNWAENRAKIPSSWLREMLGTVLDRVYDSGERDKFRTILERNGDVVEVYISHEHMVEVRIGVDEAQTRWERGREDPGLNAAMLARLMVFLGEETELARQKMAQAEQTALKPVVQDNVSVDGTLTIDESFEMSWRRVGLALDSGNFAVDDRDRSAGDFFVRYVDTDTGLIREEPSIFGRLFGAKDPEPAPQYRLHLQGEGDRTIVSVFKGDGQPDTSETAKRILSVLAERMQAL